MLDMLLKLKFNGLVVKIFHKRLVVHSLSKTHLSNLFNNYPCKLHYYRGCRPNLVTKPLYFLGVFPYLCLFS